MERSTVPIWPEFMRPLLEVLLEQGTMSRRALRIEVVARLGLSEDARSETLPSGGSRAENRAGWAITHATKADWVERVARATYRITDDGRAWLSTHPAGLTSFAEANRELANFWSGTNDDQTAEAVADVTSDIDPVEQIGTGIERIQKQVGTDLLERLHEQEPAFFEQAVLDLLLAMGYGGADGTATRTQLSNDGGIDGIVDQDALGLSRIYVQAKRYALDASVGRPEIQAFVGALHGAQAGQGVFITTGRFSAGARAYAESVPTRVILIDGQRMAGLMIRYGVGVQVKRTVHIVEIDEDFFE